MDITILYYLIPSLFMFCAGVYGFITRRNLLAMLVSLELILNAVNVNFVVFNRFLYPEALEGFFFTLFVIGGTSRGDRHHHQRVPQPQERPDGPYGLDEILV